MHHTKCILLPSLIALSLAACGDSDTDDKKNLTPGPGVFVADFKTSDDFFTQMSGTVEGDSPHKNMQIWYSKNAKANIDGDDFPVPVGTVSIKESYGEEGKELQNYTVMIKKEAGYDPDNGDWHYEMRTPNGEIAVNDGNTMSGKLAGCISCHSGAADTDYLAGTAIN